MWTGRIIPQSNLIDLAPTTRSSIALKSQSLKILSSLAGNVSATSHHQLDKNAGVRWFCDCGEEEGDSKDDTDDAVFPTKACKEHLQGTLLFPDCANPETLEYAYSANPNWVYGYGNNGCPIGMYRIPVCASLPVMTCDPVYRMVGMGLLREAFLWWLVLYARRLYQRVASRGCV